MQHPIVFIHGSGDNARVWRYQLDHFGPGRAFAIDLPGHGQRPDSLPPEVSVLDYAQAVHTILQDELHAQRPVIAGQSLGGAIALMMGIEYGSELGGLVLIGTGARLRVRPDLLEGAKNAPSETTRQLKELAVAPANTTTVPGQIMQEQSGGNGNMLYRDLAACNVFDCMPRLHEIQIPTLIICGADDRLTPIKYSQYLHERIPGSMLQIVPNAGHYVMREQPEAVNAAIDQWLSRFDAR